MKRTPYEASAIALEPCHLKAIPRTQFMLFMQEFQAVGRNSFMAMTREYDAAALSARRLALSGSAGSKLASVLVDWGSLVLAGEVPDGTPHAPNTVQFHMPLTHEELGHMAGISRETVTRILPAMRREGFITLEEETMSILNLQALRDYHG